MLLQAQSLTLDSNSEVLVESNASNTDTGMSTITLLGDLDNQGTISSGFSLTVAAAGITNAGGVSAQNLLLLNAGNGLNNTGTIFTNGNITVRVNGTLSGTGSMVAGNTLDIADLSGGSSESVDLGGGMVRQFREPPCQRPNARDEGRHRQQQHHHGDCHRRPDQ